ncbi:MAG TPA: hypothetical protein VFT45_10515 [Longimicrobium sp.]|nr:hypothetical protein [Longimicrobium sp.]
MKRVIERCPNCGVEHDDPKGGACEVCGTALRFWCRVHSKEIGWLNSATCPRCAAEAARSTPPPRAPAAPPSRAPAPAPRPTPPTPRVPDPTLPAPRPPAPAREEADEPVWMEVPTSPPPRRTRSPRPWGGRDPGVVLREGAEELAPYAEAGANMAGRMVRAFFAVIGSVIGFGLLGAVVGYLFPDLLVMGGATAEPIWTAMAGAMVGGGLGLFIGTIRAIRILFAAPRRPDG